MCDAQVSRLVRTCNTQCHRTVHQHKEIMFVTSVDPGFRNFLSVSRTVTTEEKLARSHDTRPPLVNGQGLKLPKPAANPNEIHTNAACELGKIRNDGCVHGARGIVMERPDVSLVNVGLVTTKAAHVNGAFSTTSSGMGFAA